MFETNPTPREAKISSIQPFDIATRRVSSRAFKTVGTAKKCAKQFQKGWQTTLRLENEKIFCFSKLFWPFFRKFYILHFFEKKEKETSSLRKEKKASYNE